jgi:hypothetical protein
VRWAVIPFSVLLCCAQVAVTLICDNRLSVYPTSTLISVLGLGAFVVLLLLVNPLLKLVRVIRPLNRAELTSIFAALLVTAGIGTFGLASQLIPIIPAPWNGEWNTPQRGWDQQLHPYLNRSLYITDAAQVRVYREGITQAADGTPLRRPLDDAPLGEVAGYYWQVARAIPWSLWIKPLALWMVFVAGCYAIFYFLTYTVLDYWSNREKLIFPLAKLPESLLPEENGGLVPPIFKSAGFWITFGISFLIMSYRAVHAAGWAGGMGAFNLGMGNLTFTAMVNETIFQGLGGQAGLQFSIIFTAVGLAFLLPLEISFSTWFYTVVGAVIIMVMCWMGYGVNHADFPSDWLWRQNPVSAQGAGGILLFSAVCLYRAVKEYLVLGRGRSIGERLRLAIPVVGLFISMAVVTCWVYWNLSQVQSSLSPLAVLFWSAAFVLFVTLTTLGLMRIVCEGGVFWFQSHASFFHFWKMLGLGQWLAPAMVAPLLPIYSVLFLDIKTFIAPNIANAAKMEQNCRVDRVKFHSNIVLSVALSVALALGLSVFLAYLDGAQKMQSWFYSSGPRSMLDTAYSAATTPVETNWATTGWAMFGAFWVALTIVLRRTLFWFPHPIGYIMLINPLMKALWFSFFIGWVLKKITVKYGGKVTYDRLRDAFIGLIMGEILAIVIWNVIAMSKGITLPGIDLNRYGV